MALTKVKASNITLTTPSASSNDVTPATTEYVTTALANLVDSAPSTLNTLNELAAALGDDVNFSTTVTNSIATKAPLASPTFTGNATIGGNLVVNGADLDMASIIRHIGDTDTYFGFPADNQWRFVGGNAEVLRLYQIAGATGVVQVAGLGTATYPNYTFNGDTNTGMYSSSADTLSFTTAGSESFRINSDNWLNVTANVATDNPADYRGLHFGWNHTNGEGESHIVFNKGGGTTGGLGFSDNSANGSLVERMKIEGDGAITIGSPGVSTDRIKFAGNTNVGAPDTSNHDQGTRITFYDSNATAWYAMGVQSNSMWFNSDQDYMFYQDGDLKVRIDGSATLPIIRVGPNGSNSMKLGSMSAVFPYSGLSLVTADTGTVFSIHSGTNSYGSSWGTIGSAFPDFLRGLQTFNTINTSQQANIIAYLTQATKVYLVRNNGWNLVPLTGWTRISNVDVTESGQFCYVKWLQAGTHSLDNDSALYFFEAPKAT